MLNTIGALFLILFLVVPFCVDLLLAGIWVVCDHFDLDAPKEETGESTPEPPAKPQAETKPLSIMFDD